jgi:hypothetical protein
MARLIIRSIEQPAEIIELKPGVNRFGRNYANHHLLNHPAISDQHCEIMVENEFVFVRDLGSTNGTFIDQQLIKESALYAGQTLQIGPVEMVLEAPMVRVELPELPPLPLPLPVKAGMLQDGYAGCLNHGMRHAVWECTHCTRLYCNECIRKLRRVGGKHLRFCPACNSVCKFSPWSEMVRGRKKSLFTLLAEKVKGSFKRTRLLLTAPGSEPEASKKQQPRE